MMKIPLPFIMVSIGLAAAGGGQRNQLAVSIDYRYSAAFISTISSSPGRTELVIFPFHGKAVKIPIRFGGSPFTYSPNGMALYSQCTPDPVRPLDPVKIALCKIELKTLTTTPVPGSTGLYVYNFAVSNHEDHILASGVHRQDENSRRGMFEITISDGRTRAVSLESDKATKLPWGNLSLSVDGKSAVATHDGRVEIIDIARGSTESLKGEFFMATWSPDGKWLAAIEKGENGHTILMDAKTLDRKRTLGPSELGWSPDSRYLLGIKPCGPYSGTLEAINVESSERTIIESSKCQVNQATTGWVSNDIYEK